VHVNTTSGYGNFHMKPNGVFYVSVDRATVAETRAFLKQRPQTDLATQSGPIQGEVSFDAFARLFRDGLNCPNALFLDGGSAASLYAPSLNSHGNIVSLGPMLAVFERNRGASRQ